MAATDSAFEHRSHGRVDESLCVGSVGPALLAGKDGVAVADRHEGARESLDCFFGCGSFEAAIFLVLTVDAGAEDEVRELLADVSGLRRSFGFRIPEPALTCVVGLGSGIGCSASRGRPACIRSLRWPRSDPRLFDGRDRESVLVPSGDFLDDPPDLTPVRAS